MVDADADPAFVVGEVVDPIGDRLADLAVEKIMDADRDGLPVGPPFATGILKVADQFLLLRIDRDRGLPVLMDDSATRGLSRLAP